MNRQGVIVFVFVLAVLCTGTGVVAAENVGDNQEANKTVGPADGPSVGTTLEINEVFGGPGFDNTDSVVQTQDGGFALAGRKSSGGGQSSDARLIKTNSTGDIEDDLTFDLSDLDIPNSVIQAGDNDFVVAGRTFQDGDSNPGGFLIKTDSNGNTDFPTRTFGGPNFDNVFSVVQTQDGGFALAGFSEVGDPPNRQGWLVKTDSSGNVEFEKTFGGPGRDTFRSVIQTEDGGFALAGTFRSENDDFWLLKTDQNGNVELNKTYASSFNGEGEDEAFSVIQTLDGGFALGGFARPTFTTNNEAWLVKTYPNGTEQWNNTYGGSGADNAFSAIQTADGGFALGGESDSFGLDSTDFWITKTGRNGTEQWNNTYGGSGFDRAEDVIQTRDGAFALAGSTDSFDSFTQGTDGWFIKTRFCVDTTGDGDPDTDGDGLCDNWESEGVDADGDGKIDLDLHKDPYNADPMHKDLFLEIDYMGNSSSEPARGHQPQQKALQNVTNAFANAPVSNPDGNQGIDLHIRVDTPGNNLSESQELNHRFLLDYGFFGNNDFDNVKDNNFGAPGDSNKKRFARFLTHRYGIFAHQHGMMGSSGHAEGIPGNDFIVSLGGFTDSVGGASIGNVTEQQSTLMHEFGHTLGLRHGGFNDRNCKPNYLSIMSYSFQFQRSVPGGRPLDYSNESLPTLNENNLDETVGVQGPAGQQTIYDAGTANFNKQAGPFNGPIDWNADDDRADEDVSRDINWIDAEGCQGDADFDGNPDGKTQLEGHNDWANLVYNFRGTPAFADGVHPTPPGTQELTAEEVQNAPDPTLAVETNVSSVEVDASSGVLVNVTDADDGAPVENAVVNITGAGVEVPDRTTDAGGMATFSLNPDQSGDITVRATKPGFLPGETTVQARASDGLSPNNPFSDANGNPVTRRTVINRVVQWNMDGEIDGTPFTRQEIIGFVVEWNLAT